MLSLRTRLQWGIITGTVLLLAVFSSVVYTVIRQSLIGHFDQSLLVGAHLLSAVIEEEYSENPLEYDASEASGKPMPKLDLEFDVRMTPEFDTLNGGAYYQIWDAGGKTLIRSPSLGDKNLPFFQEAADAPAYREITLPDKTPGRAVWYPFLPQQENPPKDGTRSQPLTLVLARDASDMAAHLNFLKWLLLIASAAVIFLSSGLASVVTRTGLQPIYTLAQHIRDVGEDTLAQQFPPEAYPAELSPICRRLNEALGRLDKSFIRERRFNANVAHELRTPLSGLRSTIEVCLSRPRQDTDYRQALENCLPIVHTMNHMIETLLSLSRLEAGRVALQQQTVHLGSEIDRLWRLFADDARDKAVTFENTVGDAVCRTDRTHLDMILSNVLENAVAYTNDGGRIWTTVERQEGTLTLMLSNTGCELTEADAENVFDFFWRKSRSRTDTGRHCGIGLSVAKKIADVLGIDMAVTIKGDIFTVRLDIPKDFS